MKVTWRVISRGVGRRREGEKVQRISSINGRLKNRQGEGKNSIGNVEAKGLICTTQGHELKGWGMLVGGIVKGGGE